MKFVPSAGATNTFVTGAANITILPEGKVKICYLDRFDREGKITKEMNFSDGQKCKIFDGKDLPMAFSAEDEGAEVVLRVKSEGNTIVEFLPENEVVQGRFKEFWRKNGEGTSPIPEERKKFKDTDDDVLQFCALFNIEGGAFDGKVVAQFLQFCKSGKSKKTNTPYSFSTFTEDEEGNVALGFQPLPDGSTGYKWSDQIYSLRHCGLLEGGSIKMPEDGNPLLLIEQKLQQANKLVELEVVKGYVSTVSSGKKVALFKAPAKTEEHEPGLPKKSDVDEM